jgi:glycerol-1-phosphate dehydrogenase [NAD(P)+]
MEMIVAPDALAQLAERFTANWPDSEVLLVADGNTWEAAGSRVASLLETTGIGVKTLVFADQGRVVPDYDHVKLVLKSLDRVTRIPIAVGAGSINDIVKLASHESNRGYCCIPTAPSVDGYTSANAPITFDGFKRTLACTPPQLIVADVEILSEAPLWLISSGYGDLMAKITVGADWIVADELHIESIDHDIWEYVQGPLWERIGQPEEILDRQPHAIDLLFSGLVETGIAMKRYGSSRPASGAEHLLSHVWEMEHLTYEGQEVSHGHKVALGTLVSTALHTLLAQSRWSWVIEQALAELEHAEEYQVDILGGAYPEEMVKIAESKMLASGELEERRQLIHSHWKQLGDRLSEQLIPFDRLRELLQAAHCPVEPADIGLSRTAVAKAMYIAPFIRTRYTVLDLARDCGILEPMIEEIVYTDRWFSRFMEV